MNGNCIKACLLLLFCVSFRFLPTALASVQLGDYDAEIPDEAITEDMVNNEMSNISDENLFEASLNEDEPDPDSDADDLERLLHEQLLREEEEQEDVNSDSESDRGDYDGSHFIHKRSLRDFFFENLLRELMNDVNVLSTSTLGVPRTKCMTFASPDPNSRSSCGVTNTTLLGAIQWCRITCTSGYKLKEQFPEYELCGKATKFRWTYQLRGLRKGIERCVASGTPTNQTNQKACITPECMESAAYYMNKIDFDTNPCDNFYEFACGRWLKEAKIPPSKSHYLTYTTIRDRVTLNVAALLEQPYRTTECPAVQKVKIAYKACMNMDLINELDSNPLRFFLKNEFSWPIVQSSWDEDDYDFEKTLGSLRGRFNNQILFNVLVRRHNGNHILQTWKGRMALPFAYFLDDRYKEKLDAYYDLLEKIALMLGGDISTVRQDIAKIKQFEKQIAFHKLHDWDYYTSKTIDQMSVEMPGVDWLRLFKTMIKSHPISGSTVVQVWNVNYLKNVIALMSVYDKRTVQNYMMWRFVKHRIRNLSARFERAYLEYENKILGKKSLPRRNYKCAQHLLFSMKGATGKLFIDKYFSPSKKKAAKNLFKFIRKGFIHLLDTEVKWMDNKTRAYARKKALAITSDIGYNPKIYQNTTHLDLEVAHLTVKSWDYFGNTLRILTTIAQNKFKLIGEPYNTSVDQFNERPTMVNAFYSPTKNRITLPAGEMQYPFYWGDRFPRMFQFGGIGTILGHELTHGFDNTGRLYDLHGNMRNWWSPTSLLQFKKRTHCMVNQYNNYFFQSAGENLNGQSTLGENIADNGGIRESFEGYHLWLKALGKTGENVEPTTGLTNDQMFFVGFANVRCGKFTHAGAVHEVAKDVHSPGQFRVIGSLQNFDKFSKAYNCPVGSKMNPTKKCIIW